MFASELQGENVRRTVLQTNPWFAVKIALDSPSTVSKHITELLLASNRCMEILTALLLLINSLFVGEAPLTESAIMDFGLKMEPYYEAAGHSTDTSNTSLHELPNTYWGATVWSGRCTNRVYLSDRFIDPAHPFFGTPMWKYVLAHEWAHVAQGVHCWENEAEAQLIALAVLADAGEWEAVYTVLEWMLALSAPEDARGQLRLDDAQQRYYDIVTITQLEAVEMLLGDDDGLFALRTGYLDARTLWQFLQDTVELSLESEFVQQN